MRYLLISISAALILVACAPAATPTPNATPTTVPTSIPPATPDAQAAATSQAQASSTAQAAANATSDAGLTRIAAVVVTANAERTATSVAQRTATAQPVLPTVGALVKSANKVHGPSEGILELGRNRTANTSVNLRNFVVEARFTNPADRAVNPWDYGFGFRQTATTACAVQYAFYLNSDQTYRLSLWTGFRNPDQTCITTGVNGNAGAMNLAQGESNAVKLVVHDAQAYLFVNGEFRATLNVSENNTQGGVWISTGIRVDHQFPGLATPTKSLRSTRCHSTRALQSCDVSAER